MDAKDRQIIRALQISGRLTNQELSEKVNLSPSPCSRRVRALEESGVITGYTALVDEVPPLSLAPVVSEVEDESSPQPARATAMKEPIKTRGARRGDIVDQASSERRRLADLAEALGLRGAKTTKCHSYARSPVRSRATRMRAPPLAERLCPRRAQHQSRASAAESSPSSK